MPEEQTPEDEKDAKDAAKRAASLVRPPQPTAPKAKPPKVSVEAILNELARVNPTACMLVTEKFGLPRIRRIVRN